MAGTSEPAGAPPDPVLSRRIRLLQVVLATVAALAAGTEFVRLLVLGAPAGGYVALAAAATGAVLCYRRPGAGLVLVAGAPLLATALAWDPLVPWTIGVFSALVLTLRGSPGTRTAVVVGLANFAAVGLSHDTVALTDPSASVAGFAAVAAAAIGSAIRDHHRYLGELHQRTHDALAGRRAAVDRGIAEERVRIARDLHDGLGQRIAVLSMRLGAAEVHLPAGAEDSRTDIVAARSDVQAVLLETQQILRVLRVDDDAGGADPAPAIDRIPELVAGFRASGLEIEATLGDLTLPVAAHVGAAAFRITQEVLTNAHRHGTGAVSLRVDTAGGAIVIESVNAHATGASSTGGGFGLTGLRERAASTGGTVEVRPDDDLFTVRVVLPARGAPA
jgi:signal transduction histidine kinase